MKNLFDETTLGGVTLRNRAWRSATWLGLAGRNGEITNGTLSGTGFCYFCMSGFPAFHAWPTFSPEI